MKVSIGVVAKSMKSLNEFANTDMGAALAFRLQRVVAVVNAQIAILADVEHKLVEKYNGKINGVAINFTNDDDRDAFQKEMIEAEKVEIELPCEKLTEADILTVSKIKPAILHSISWLLE